MSANTMKPEQADVLAFLGSAAAYAGRVSPKRIDTHAAIVFLAGPDAYKVKRAVNLPFLDYSTLEKRKKACEAEVAVNIGNAPDLYLGTVPITLTASGLALGGSGEPIEWAVHLKRFDESQTLDHVAARGELGPELVRTLANAVARAHRLAKARTDANATRSLGGVVEETCAALDEARGDLPAVASDLANALRAEWGRVREQCASRETQGQVRECHGDLHLRNIVLIGGKPVLFDAIEFDPALSTIDVLYDLAFLLMDLEVRGLKRQANQMLNRYLWLDPKVETQLGGLSLMPIFLSLRAAIRAKVEILRFHAAHESDAIRSAICYLEAGIEFLNPSPPLLIAIGGLSGTGKSTLAARIATMIGRRPGAVHLRSDIERKRLGGVGERDRLPEDAYAPSATRQVYGGLAGLSQAALRAGQAVIVDATYVEAEERNRLETLARRAGVPFRGVWLKAPMSVRVDRVADRLGDASDATASTARGQTDRDPESEAWAVVDASGSLDETERLVRSALGLT